MTLRKLLSFIGPGLLGAFSTASAGTVTATSLAISPNPALAGSPVTLTATVSAVGATGQVTFYDGATVLGVAGVSGGSAALTTVLLPTGSQPVRARYDGDATYAPSLSAAIAETVSGGSSTSFASPAGYAAQLNPNGVALGDLNKDGNADMVIPNHGAGTFSVFLGNGDGTFQPQVTYAAISLTAAAVIADFNRDGNPDVAVIGDSTNGSAVNIYLGNGDGTLQTTPLSVAVPGVAQSLAAADLNGDGIVDVVVGTETGIQVLLGSNTVTFSAQPFITLPGTPGQVIAADFRNTGTADIAAAIFNGASANMVEILLNNGNGTFAAPELLAAGQSPTALAAADLNGDGKLDLAAANFGAADAGVGNVSIFWGNGDGTFQPAANLPATASNDYPSSIVAGDFNGDGTPDLAITNFGAGTVFVYYGIGNGAFGAPASLSVGASAEPIGLAAANFTHGGSLDLAVANFGNSSVSVFLGTGGTCSVLVSPIPLGVNSVGGAVQLTVSATGGCSYPISTDQPGFVHPASNTGSGSGTITINFDANTTGVDRTANLFVGNVTVPVTQYFTTAVFLDVQPGAFAFDAINLMAQYGITTGCGSNDYCPTDPVTRAEMAIFIVRGIYGGDNFPAPSQTPYFNDVSPSTFGFNWIQKLFELGITSGCGGGDYCPNDTVTRGAMAKFIILARYGATTAYTVPSTIYFPADVPPSYVFYPEIERMAEDGITTGCGGTSYCPSDNVSRAQMAVFIIRGELNQLLPPTEPLITSISPNTLAVGTSGNFTITGVNTTFNGGTVIVPAGGVTASNVVVVSPTEITATLTSASGSAANPVSIYVQTEPQEAVLPNGLKLQ